MIRVKDILGDCKLETAEDQEDWHEFVEESLSLVSFMSKTDPTITDLVDPTCLVCPHMSVKASWGVENFGDSEGFITYFVDVKCKASKGICPDEADYDERHQEMTEEEIEIDMIISDLQEKEGKGRWS